jgi:hypothetical protein
METMNVSSVLTLFPSSKDEQDVFVDKLIKSLQSGDIDPLKVEAQMVNLEQVVKKYRSNKIVKDAVLTEAEKYGEKSFDIYGANVQIKEVGTKYNFLEVGHEKYNEICKEIDFLSEKKKELETILKAHSEKWVEVDFDSGNTYEVLPLSKSSTTQVVLTIKK